jgi:uncharacterized delta-60 repeat protein
VQADGKILVGGYFTMLGGVARSRIGRLNSDGTLDTTFNPGANDTVLALALQADGKILVGGVFTTLGGEARSRIGRLNSDGSLDADFDPGADGNVYTLAVQADGKIVVGGGFTTLGGSTRIGIGRLNTDGSLDADFDPGADSGVITLALQADGKIVVGGYFTTLGGQTRNYIGRLSADTAALQNLSVNPAGTTVIWMRSGSGPEVWRVTFEQSTDGTAYTSLGAGTRISGGWELTGLSLPRGQNLWLRARGYYSTGQYNGSASVVESVRNIYIPKWDTTTALASSLNPSGKGQSVTFTATVTSTSGTPTGTVAFKDGGSTITDCGAKALSGGHATCTTASLASGKHDITAQYSGDANFNSSNSSTLKQNVKTTVTFKSTGTYDGWVLESSETSGVGGTMDSTSKYIQVGDNAQKKQYRGLLSFDTASLPDTAVITKVTLKLKLQDTVGANPFNTHGNLLVDIRKGAFSGSGALQLGDFQAAASKSSIGSIPKTPSGGWYSKIFSSTVFTYINKKGVTQFRLRFSKDADNDDIADYLKFYSGNAGTSANRPQLIIEYYVP